jgi:hypothetical protein
LPEHFDSRDVFLKFEFKPAVAQAISLGDPVGVEISWRFFVVAAVAVR